jgi:hypothetical protein
MNNEALKWLHEADINIGRVERVLTLTGSITSGDAETLYKQGYEYSLKAPLAEKYNGIPSSYHSHPLTVLSKQYGLFDLLTLELQQSLADMDRHFSYPAYPGSIGYNSLVSSSSPAQWNQRIARAKELREFVKDVINTSSLFSRLTL